LFATTVLPVAVALRPDAVVSVTVTVHEGPAPVGVVQVVVTVVKFVGPIGFGLKVPPQLEVKEYVHSPVEEPGLPVAVSTTGDPGGTGTIKPLRKTLGAVVIQPTSKLTTMNTAKAKLLRNIF